MAQRHQIRGNVIIPLTDHFGFGLPGAPGNLDSSTGPRFVFNTGNPNAVVTAPQGSICLDSASPGLWLNTTGAAVWVAFAGAAGGGGMLPMRDAALVDPDHPNAVDDTDITTPFVTIQAAITALENEAFVESANSRTPYLSAAQMKIWTVVVAQGIYDEDLTIPAGLFFALIGRGTVVLGDGAAANLQSTNARNITVLGDTNNVPATEILPGLVMTTWSESVPDAGGGGFANIGSWKVSGQIIFSEAGAVGTFGSHLFAFDNVDVSDNGAVGVALSDITASTPTIVCNMRRCRFGSAGGGAVALNATGGNLMLCEETRFEGTVVGATYGTMSGASSSTTSHWPP